MENRSYRGPIFLFPHSGGHLGGTVSCRVNQHNVATVHTADNKPRLLTSHSNHAWHVLRL